VSATDQARLLLTELISAGVTDLVIAPGSRNGPISLAALDAERANLIKIQVRIDERSAAFTALGIAKVTKRKVAVVVTSGTAGAHLLPALIEAAQCDLSIIAITADRPTELVNTGASQTIEQLQLFSSVTSNVVDLLSDWPAEMWQNEIKVALTKPGVLHLNPRFSEPLIPTSTWEVPKIEAKATSMVEPKLSAAELLNNKRGIVIAATDQISHAVEIATALNWPLFAEPAAISHPNLVSHSPLTISKLAEQVEVVVSVGRVGLARSVTSVLNTKPRVAVKLPTLITKAKTIAGATGELDLTNLETTDASWIELWLQHATAVSTIVDGVLNESELSGIAVAQVILDKLTATNSLHVAASLSLRDLDFMMKSNQLGLLTANRGVNGIDGIVATAIGAAIAWQHAGNGQSYCLLGDVALLHDLTSLTIPATEEFPNLRLVVVDNNGGGVFSTIEQRGVAGFERVFGTPHQANLATLLSGFGIDVTEIDSTSALDQIFITKPGLSAVVISGINRDVEADIRKALVNLTR
jgi:2-succinyl-5-enolpyruvyl-6-hydroxy-3-cyclohexene-1-carboxylate synthase